MRYFQKMVLSKKNPISLSNYHETLWKWSSHEVIIFNKFHEDCTKVVIFLLMVYFWKWALFYFPDFNMQYIYFSFVFWKRKMEVIILYLSFIFAAFVCYSKTSWDTVKCHSVSQNSVSWGIYLFSTVSKCYNISVP